MTAKTTTGLVGLLLALLLAAGVAFWVMAPPGWLPLLPLAGPPSANASAGAGTASTAPLREELHALWLMLEPAAGAPDGRVAEARARLELLADRLDRSADPLRMDALLATLAGRLEGTLASLGEVAPPAAVPLAPALYLLPAAGLVMLLLGTLLLLRGSRQPPPVAPAAPAPLAWVASLQAQLGEALADVRTARSEALQLATGALDLGARLADADRAATRDAERLAELACRLDAATERLEQVTDRGDAAATRQQDLAATLQQARAGTAAPPELARLGELLAGFEAATERLEQVTDRGDAAATRQQELAATLHQAHAGTAAPPELARLGELLTGFEAAAHNLVQVEPALQRMTALAEDRDKAVRELLPLTIGINELMRRLEDQASNTGRATIESGQRVEAQALAGAAAIRQAASAFQQEAAAALARLAAASTEGVQHGAEAVREATLLVAQAAEAAIARIGAASLPAETLQHLASRLEGDAQATEAAIARLEAAVPRQALEALASQLAEDARTISPEAALRAAG